MSDNEIHKLKEEIKRLKSINKRLLNAIEIARRFINDMPGEPPEGFNEALERLGIL